MRGVVLRHVAAPAAEKPAATLVNAAAEKYALRPVPASVPRPPRPRKRHRPPPTQAPPPPVPADAEKHAAAPRSSHAAHPGETAP